MMRPVVKSCQCSRKASNVVVYAETFFFRLVLFSMAKISIFCCPQLDCFPEHTTKSVVVSCCIFPDLCVNVQSFHTALADLFLSDVDADRFVRGWFDLRTSACVRTCVLGNPPRYLISRMRRMRKLSFRPCLAQLVTDLLP